MNGIMNTYIQNTSSSIVLKNALIEEFNDGVMIHADGVQYTIPGMDISAVEHTENEDRYWLKSQLKIVITWE